MADFFQASYFVSEVIALFGIGLNAFQIYHTMRNNLQRTPFDSSIFSLPIADLLSASFILAFMIYWHLLHNSVLQRNENIDTAIIVLLQYSFLSSIFHLVCIAIIRITAVISPLKFGFLITSRLPYISIATIWTLSSVFSVVNVFLITLDVIGYITLSAQALLVVIYVCICCAVKKQDIAVSKLSALKQQRPPVFRHTLLHSVFVTSAFIICTLPSALYSVRIVNRVDPSYIYEWVRWMFYLNPTIDSMLYFYFSQKFTRSRHIRFSFKNKLNCNFYNLESARKANKMERRLCVPTQKFAVVNTEPIANRQ